MSISARIARRIDDQHVLSVLVADDASPETLLATLGRMIARDGIETVATTLLAHAWAQISDQPIEASLCADGDSVVCGYGETIDGSSQRLSMAPLGQHPFAHDQRVTWTYLLSADLDCIEVWGTTLIATLDPSRLPMQAMAAPASAVAA